tara:strand:+ start:240 stop:542 length:303 start_codon:yes stop_codon:yes gene_type:complete
MEEKITKESLGEEEKTELNFETGEKEADVYSDEGLENLQEDDEISPEEEGFMEGEQHGDHNAKCAKCGKIFDETDKVYEREINGEVYRFCSKDCDELYNE